MDPIYTTWFHHREEPTATQKPKLVEISKAYTLYSATYARDANHLEPLDEAREDNFAKELEDAETPSYSSCENYTKLSVVVTLYKIKAKGGWTDESFTKLLVSLHHMFPRDNAMLYSVKQVREFLKTFELCYLEIDACVKDCCLFRKKNAQLENYSKCGHSRWKVDAKTKIIIIGVAAKVLRYFPIIPKFQNMIDR
ncbi:hypothetical protein Vadar_011456 [Vaccinium darrowii]|uniref:Uncharacterized protein n=1 Tax=Vaccinium darrowii TaxID=229202 RepID=A0ACB7XQ82_9ERIC|nr:hypothetical protein Vadar_011456 [Vaccinium darrowii]